MAWLSNRFVRLGLLVLFASCVSAWLLGCAATGAHTQAWAQTTPNGIRVFRICRRHPHVDPNARYWYDVGDGTPRTTFLPLDELLESREAKAVYIHDASAPSESRKLLGIAFQHLPCDKPPPPPPEKRAAKEKEDGEKKDEAQSAEPPKSRPKPIATLPARCPEPGQARRRGGTGARTCTRTLVYASEQSRQASFRRAEDPPAAGPRPVEAPAPIDPSQVPPGEVRVYEDWRQTPEETALLDRAQECLTGACHARHKNFQPKGGKKPSGTHHGQSLSTGSGSGGGAGAPRPAPKTTVKTTTKPVSKPNGAAGGKARLPPKGTPERRAIETARKKGVHAKQAQELTNIRAGGRGSGVWTDKELKGIRETGEFPTDATWHHDPTVANRPDLAADPSVVRPVRGGTQGHLQAHGGDFRKP